VSDLFRVQIADAVLKSICPAQEAAVEKDVLKFMNE